MNKNVFSLISSAVSAVEFFACSSIMPKIQYHGPGFEK